MLNDKCVTQDASPEKALGSVGKPQRLGGKSSQGWWRVLAGGFFNREEEALSFETFLMFGKCWRWEGWTKHFQNVPFCVLSGLSICGSLMERGLKNWFAFNYIFVAFYLRQDSQVLGRWPCKRNMRAEQIYSSAFGCFSKRPASLNTEAFPYGQRK